MFESLISQIVYQFKPAQIILFGPFAKGTYHKYSEIDLCIIMETTNKRNTLTDLYYEIRSDSPLNIILYTPDEWVDCVRDPCSFAFRINNEGIVLHGNIRELEKTDGKCLFWELPNQETLAAIEEAKEMDGPSFKRIEELIKALEEE